MRIRNWKKHQHFKDRRPPWIKLHREILEDREWSELRGDDAKFLVELWLLASEDKDQEGNLPPLSTIAWRLRRTEKSVSDSISRLSAWVERRDITAISERYQDGLPEIEIEKEGETEKEAAPAALVPAVAVTPSFPDVCLELAERLKAGILRNNPAAKTPPKLDQWAKCADLMLRVDKRTPEQIAMVIDFSQFDSFWRINVLSMDAVRRQFDKLVNKMKSLQDSDPERKFDAEMEKQKQFRKMREEALKDGR